MVVTQLTTMAMRRGSRQKGSRCIKVKPTRVSESAALQQEGAVVLGSWLPKNYWTSTAHPI